MKRIVILLLAVWNVCHAISLMAQSDRCVIQGKIDKTFMDRSHKELKMVYLSGIDEYDRPVHLDSTVVNKGNFRFDRKLTPDDPILMFLIQGFDNGAIHLFVEPGTVEINLKDASYPMAASVRGTSTNDLYARYKAITQETIAEQMDSLKVIRQNMPEGWMDSEEGRQEWMRIGAASLIANTAERLEFILDHNDSPLAPLMLEKELYFMLSKEYAKQMLQCLSPRLFDHPYYRSYNNVVRALDLKVGAELPDITIPILEGRSATLSSFRGKYVILDFWASWCGPCRKEIPYLIQLFEESKDQRDKFVIISFSLDEDEKAWKGAVNKLGINRDGWINASDLLAWGSPAATMMGVTEIPKVILIDPEGKAISFSLRGEELVRRVKQILQGDRYYQKVETN